MKLKQTGKLAPANKPWKLIRDAIADLTLQEKCKSVRIDMNHWHSPNGRCKQCLAGTAISRRLGSATSTPKFPSDFPAESGRLHALDWFRTGNVLLAYDSLGMFLPESVSRNVDVPEYSNRPGSKNKNFKRAMLNLATMLYRAHKGKPAISKRSTIRRIEV